MKEPREASFFVIQLLLPFERKLLAKEGKKDEVAVFLWSYVTFGLTSVIAERLKSICRVV